MKGSSAWIGCDCENHNGMLSKLTLRLRFDILQGIKGVEINAITFVSTALLTSGQDTITHNFLLRYKVLTLNLSPCHRDINTLTCKIYSSIFVPVAHKYILKVTLG